MKNRNARTLIISLGMMLLMCVATALLSFSLADEGTKEGELVSPADSDAFSTTKTNIDYIIENSKAEDPEISYFRIVEIGAAATSANSPLRAMVEQDTVDNTGDFSQFVKQVINGWSTQNEEMVKGRIQYQYFHASTADVQDMKSAIGRADLIYVSNEKGNEYSPSNDIPEDVKLLLSAAATGTYTPFIIDSPTKTKYGDVKDDKIKSPDFCALATQIFNRVGRRYSTYPYQLSKTYGSTAEEIKAFLSYSDSSSYWRPISGDMVKGDWYTTEEYERAVSGKDAEGYPIYQVDANGNPVYVQAKDGNGNLVFEYEHVVDETGKETDEILKDNEGNPIQKIKKNDAGKYLFTDPDKDNEIVEIDAIDETTRKPVLAEGDTRNLEPVYIPVYATVTKTTARILTIGASASDNSITSKFKAAAGSHVYDTTALEALSDFSTISSSYSAYVINPNNGNSKAYTLENTLYKYGYALSKVHPNNVLFDFATPADLFDSDLNLKSDINLGAYDLIIVEAGVKNQKMSGFSYKAFNSLVYGSQHIVYAPSLVDSSGGGSGSNTHPIEETDAPNYGYVMAKVADANETARFTNVLVTGKEEMSVYAAAQSPNGVKPIADIINNGSYRGSGGGGSSSNLYTVLEIQPCYPIDLELAKAIRTRSNSDSTIKDYMYNKQKNYTYDHDRNDILYYVKMDSVLNNVTSDEITFDGGLTSLTDMESNDNATTGISGRRDFNNDASASLITGQTVVDYYAWELSKAKVAFLTGLDFNKVNVVHMSSSEFATSRESLLDNYDAIYIGGKNTAIKQKQYWMNYNNNNALIYNMYFHNGSYYDSGQADGKDTLTGNDITYDRLIELEAYITAGMPVIFTKDLTEAYFTAYAEKNGGSYNQTKSVLDPESHVYKLMEYCMNCTSAQTNSNGDYYYPTKDSMSNVLAGFDPTDCVKAFNDGSYGNTYGGYVTVFGGLESNVYIKGSDGTTTPHTITPSTTAVNAAEFTALLAESRQRPKFALTQTPMLYVEGDVSTEIRKGSTITFEYDVAPGFDYVARVYIDDNTNSRFEETTDDGGTEIIYSGKDHPIKIKLPESFDGGLYWKFEIESNGSKSSVTGISKVAIDDENRNYVSVLQITPEIAGTTASDNNSSQLIFCTECQQIKYILKGNRKVENGNSKFASQYYRTGGHFDDTNDYGYLAKIPKPSSYDSMYTEDDSRYGTKNVEGHNLGIHEHNFGIVKYESSLLWENNLYGRDDWTSNWMYDLIADYDVDIDIWTTREFESFVNTSMQYVNNSTVTSASDVRDDYQVLADMYEEYYRTLGSVLAGDAKIVGTAAYNRLKNKMTSRDTSFNASVRHDLYGDDYTDAVVGTESYPGGFGADISEEEFLSYFTTQINLGAYLAALKNLNYNPFGAKTQSGTEADVDRELQYEIDYHRYSDFFSMATDFNDFKVAAAYDNKKITVTKKDGKDESGTIGSVTGYSSGSGMNEFQKLYVPWRNAKIWEMYFYRMYMKYKAYANMVDIGENGNHVYVPNLEAVYDCVVVGVGEDFGGDDLNKNGDAPRAIDTLKYYVENDGHTFIFHETISEKTPNLTANFRQLFGQDYNHLTVEKTYGPPKANLNVKAIQNGWGNTQYSSTNINSTQGLDLNITFNGSSESVTATPTNNTGVLNINWTNNGWSGGNANYYGIGVRIEVDGVMLTAIKPDNSRTGHITENLEFRQLLGAKNASEDEDRYLLPNITKNDSEVLSSTHLTYYVKDGTLTQNGKDNWFTYTQTGMEKNADLKNPVVHSSTDSTAFELQGSTFTSVATQTNKGVVTMYPFKIGSRLRIAGTHPNSFSTDIEDKNMVVYYSLNGGAKGTASATVAADPQNGIDNYWLYSYGNLTYCGAGHQNVTGLHRDNNDERRLFINVILNSGRKSIFKGDPEIKVFDSTTTEESNESNLIVKEVDGAYELVVTTNTDTPEFTFRTNVPNKKLDVEEVHIYYDCTPDVNEEHLNDVDDYGFNGSAGEVINGKKYVDTMIFNKKSTEDPKLLKDQYKQMLGEQNVQLKLKPEYFAPYNYEHTVIVIAVKTSDGNVYKQKVVIKLAPKLWDLT